MHKEDAHLTETLRAFLLVGVVFAGGLVAGAGTVRSAFGQARDAYAGLDVLARAMTTIERAYVEERDVLELSHAAIQGMIEDLDPHSAWLSPDDYQALQERAEGRYLGIGVELSGLGAADVVIGTVLPRSPAALAGIEAGDVLIAIDGQAVAELSPEAVQALLGGPARLTLRRGAEELAVTVVRDEILDISVRGEPVAGRLGYIQIERFSRSTATEVALALQQLRAHSPVEGLILDLRDNPGGLITEAVALVDLFVDQGTIVQTRGRDAEVRPEVYPASATATDELSLPLIVLINGGSASASELVAGALRDLGRATLVGTPSYGKGSMQNVYEFEDGSALKLTVARYYLPSGTTISPDAGLQPDVLVPLTAPPASVDPRLAALRDEIHRQNLPAEREQRLLELVAALPLEAASEVAVVPRRGTAAERRAVDAQLEAAVQRLLSSR